MSSRCRWWWCALPLTLIASNCLLDDERCGANQQELNSTFQGCVCEPGFVPNANGIGCRACGDNEEARSGSCVCVEGFARSNPNATCVPASEIDGGAKRASGQDMPCTTADDCASYDADFCSPQMTGSNVCLVQHCGTGAHRCDPDRDCCVVTMLPELADAEGLCVVSGTCPAGVGMVVTP
jgi:hypothetical protein